MAQPIHIAFPSGTPGPPIYANIGSGFLPHTEELAVVFFYRSPDCVPADFNLLDFLDFTPAFPGGPPRPFQCELQIEGRALRYSLDDPAPALQFFYGLGAVPTWFVAWSELEAAAEDGVLTISELAALPSLQVGSATSFLETIRNSVPAQRGGGEEVVATGVLMDGRSIVVHINEKFRDGVHLFKNIRIDIEGVDRGEAFCEQRRKAAHDTDTRCGGPRSGYRLWREPDCAGTTTGPAPPAPPSGGRSASAAPKCYHRASTGI